MAVESPTELLQDANESTAVDDRYDRIARRFRAALGGAILGSSLLSILGSAIGYNAPIPQLAGAAIGFTAMLFTVCGDI